MAKRSGMYKYDKRQKELKRKKRQEEKRQKRQKESGDELRDPGQSGVAGADLNSEHSETE